MNNPSWIIELFATIDGMNAEKFCEFMTNDGTFHFANYPPVTGRDNLIVFLDNFYKSIKGLHHTDLHTISTPEKVVTYGTVTYTRHNDTQLAVKFCDVFLMEGKLIKLYDVFIDASQLYI